MAVRVVQQVIVQDGGDLVDGVIFDIGHDGKGDFHADFFGEILDGGLKINA